MLIEMLNGGLVDIEQEGYKSNGYCPTCDYGKYTSNFFKFIFTNMKVEISVKRDYEDEFALSDSDMMKIILSNIENIKHMRECEFENFIKNEIENYLSNRNVNFKYEIICDISY